MSRRQSWPDKHQPSMIVLGTHGGGRFERGVIGSTGGEDPPVHTLAVSHYWSKGPACLFQRPFHSREFFLQPTSLTAAFNAALYAVNIAVACRGRRLTYSNVIQGGAVVHPDRLTDLRETSTEHWIGLSLEAGKGVLRSENIRRSG